MRAFGGRGWMVLVTVAAVGVAACKGKGRTDYSQSPDSGAVAPAVGRPSSRGVLGAVQSVCARFPPALAGSQQESRGRRPPDPRRHGGRSGAMPRAPRGAGRVALRQGWCG